MAARTGEQYLDALRDDRYVVLAGQRVDDVTAHPGLQAAARTVARLYDLHADAGAREVMTAPLEPGGPDVPRYYLTAGSPEELELRGRAFELVARVTGGLLGRSPDFLATILTSWAAAADYFGRRDRRFGAHVAEYRRFAAERSLCLTHAISDPPRDGAGGPGSAASLRLCCVDHGADGIVVSGAKMLATLAPFADELLVYPFRPLQDGGEEQALAFAIPLATPGLRVICRRSLAGEQDPFDLPLAERFDEMDAVCVFDEVRVPWERVFIHGDVAQANDLRSGTGMTSYAWYQSAVRVWVKAQLVAGTAVLVAEHSGRDADRGVQEKLGEMAAWVEALHGLVVAARSGAHRDRFGHYVCAGDPLGASGVLGPTAHSRMVELLQLIGGSGLVMHPSSQDLHGAEGEYLGAYFATNGARSATEHARVLNLAAELALNSFGGRQLLYERFYLGQPEAFRARFYQSYDKAGPRASALRLLEQPAEPDAQGPPEGAYAPPGAPGSHT